MERLMALVILTAFAVTAWAASPPAFINYQGVLRDSSDAPLDGDYDMVFRFYDAESGGDLLLTDRHLAAGSGSVTVADGLFNVGLGSGAITAGSYGSMAAMFAGESVVYLEIQVENDPAMTPRVRVTSAGYALNADHLDGQDSSSFAGAIHTHPGSDVTGKVPDADRLDGHDSEYFLDISSQSQTKIGTLVIDAPTVDGYAIEARAKTAGGYFQDSDGTAQAWVANGWTGIAAYGQGQGGVFRDSDNSGEAFVGYGNHGIDGFGSATGGRFADNDDTPQAEAWLGLTQSGTGDKYGVWATGSKAGGYFKDRDGSGYATLGDGEYGVKGLGNASGGFFSDPGASGVAYLGNGDWGVHAQGNTAGGWFEDKDHSGYAYVGYGNTGVLGYGSSQGGHFADVSGSPEAEAWLAYTQPGTGDKYGVRASGLLAGGYFWDPGGTGIAFAGTSNSGIVAYGTGKGGYFADTVSDPDVVTRLAYTESPSGSQYGIWAKGDAAGYFEQSWSPIQGKAWLGAVVAGEGSFGVWAEGVSAGGYFKDSDHDAEASVGTGYSGIEAEGRWLGGWFTCSTGAAFPNTYAHTANCQNGVGLEGTGSRAGGIFSDTDHPGSYAYVGRYDGESYSVLGTGTVGFVQNHPEMRDRVVVYAAPEGDEAAVYTRGTASVVDGEARVALGETFQWVTNPDIGLTAHLTPRGEAVPLAVESLTTTELVVHAPDAPQGLVFDYIVYGLRIGFEEQAIVQAKLDYSPVPDPDGRTPFYAEHPELRRFNALERFKVMRADTGIEGPPDLTRSQALVAAINVFDPAVDGKLDRGNLHLVSASESVASQPPAGVSDRESAGSSSLLEPESVGLGGALPMDAEGNVYGRSFHPSSTDLATVIPVSRPVELGEVLVADVDSPGRMRPSEMPGDPTVVGIVAGEPGVLLGSDPKQSVESAELEDGGDPEFEDRNERLVAPVAFSGIVPCKVDAGYGSIRVGDLLATSPTPGHAMRAGEPQPGTILGKALEPLDVGTGLIKVLVMLR